MVTKVKIMKDTVRKLEKHPFNVFPAMTADERKDVYLDIKNYGYDSNFPIIIYKDMVLDGWHRHEICEELGVAPLYEEYLGDDLGAIDLVWRSNKRRNITSSQWAVAAVKAEPFMDEILAAVKAEKSQKMEGNQNAKKKQMGESIPPSELPKKERDESRRTKIKLAKACHTNVKYIDKAKTLEPEVLEQVEKGLISIPDIMRVERTEAIKAQAVEASEETIKSIPAGEVQAEVKIELAEKEMLKLIRIARNKIAKLEGTLVQKEIKSEMASIFINVAPLEKIKEIQLTLGIKLTE
jgi:hypothetical protein